VELACFRLITLFGSLAAAGGLADSQRTLIGLQRLTGFLNPGKTPFGTGYQLTQALIALVVSLAGRWAGQQRAEAVLSAEAHTDLFCVLAGRRLA